MPEQDERKNEGSEYNDDPNVFWLFSGIYCMLIVILSMVICTSHYSTAEVSIGHLVMIKVDAYIYT